MTAVAPSTADALQAITDRLALRDVVDAYAHCADRRDARGQAAVFAEDGEVRLFQGSASTEPVEVIRGRDALAKTFAGLIERYDATTYLNGQSSVAVTGDEAVGETYCMAHHLLRQAGERVLLTMAIRYLDTFRRAGDGWEIARRDLVFDWTDQRPSMPG